MGHHVEVGGAYRHVHHLHCQHHLAAGPPPQLFCLSQCKLTFCYIYVLVEAKVLYTVCNYCMSDTLKFFVYEG